MRFLPVAPVALPLIVAAALAMLTKLLPRIVSSMLSIACALATAACAALLFAASLSQPIVYWFGGWHAVHNVTIGISFVIDPLGAGLATFTAVLTAVALVYAAQYFDSADNHFHSLILCFLGAMCGFSLTGDMFNLFVFFELMSAAAFALCAYKTEDPGALQGALNFGVVNTIGAYFAFTGVGLLYARTGALNMAQIADTLKLHPPDKLVAVAFTFICCGYLVKAAIVPFHFWLADAHAVAPSPICVLFSGVMVEMGLYGAARSYWAVFDQTLHPFYPAIRSLFVDLGIVTALVGGIMCYTQRNLKRLLAFSTISHMGLITIGFGLGTAAGLAGALIYVVGHGFIKGGLFLAAGILLHRFSTVDEIELYGRGRRETTAAVVVFLGALGLASIPGCGLGNGEGLMHEAAKSLHWDWVKWISVFVGAVTASAVLRAGCRIFLGWGPRGAQPGAAPKNEETRETDRSNETTPASMLGAALFLVFAGFGVAFLPALRSTAMHAAQVFQDSGAYVAHVLRGVPVTAPFEPVPQTKQGFFPFLPFVLALAGTAGYIFSNDFRSISQNVTRPLGWLHELHSGHLGDYVAVLTLGVAVFGITCLLCFG
jgi:multicomponent Na+:H+ antiporter subunit D